MYLNIKFCRLFFFLSETPRILKPCKGWCRKKLVLLRGTVAGKRRVGVVAVEVR